MNLTAAVFERLAEDAELTAMLATYRGEPAIFTIDPAPGDATLPYVVSAGETAQRDGGAKNRRGREVFRDIRCYAPASGSAVDVEALAERVRALFDRYALAVEGFETWVAAASGPIVADEVDAYGRVVSVRFLLVEEEQ